MNIMVANRLAEFRKRAGLSQEQLAEKLGISRQAVSKWERSESSPDTDNLIELSKLYGVTLDDLVRIDDDDDAPFDRAAQNVADREPEPVEAAEDSSTKINWYVFPFPILVVALYLLMGFYLNAWHPGWLMFLTIPMYYTAIEGDHFNLNKIPYPLLVVPIYLIMGFAWNAWHPGWLIFLTIPIYYTVMNKHIQSGLNLIIIALMVMGSFSMLGWVFGSWGAPLMNAIGLALVGLGLWSAMSHKS